MIKNIGNYLKKDIVLTISCVLAILSCMIQPISMQYIQYIDTHTIILLFSLMLIIEGLRQLEVFSYIGNALLSKVHSQRGLVISLVSLCFFSSMFITNDVALITFIPFGIMILEMVHMQHKMCMVVTLMTIGANLGSMFTPIGNPQNMYLYAISNMSILSFLKTMLPYTILSGVLLFICIICKTRKDKLTISMHNHIHIQVSSILFYLVLFVLCLLTVANIVPHIVLLSIIMISIFIKNKRLFTQIDYALLLTFIFFFIFVGNLNQLQQLKECITSIVSGKETIVSIILSQVLSNVPAAMLLSNYTSSITDLLIGTNIGGLGTLIASMASLISYKQIVNYNPKLTITYIKIFTLYNLMFLCVFLLWIGWM